MSKHVEQHIKDAFAKARQQPVDAHIPKKLMPNGIYTEESARHFERHAHELIAEVLSVRHPISLRNGPWYLGDLDAHPLPSAEELIAEFSKSVPRPAKKLALLKCGKMT